MEARNPYHVVLHDAMGIDSFALDGDETQVNNTWEDEPRNGKRAERR